MTRNNAKNSPSLLVLGEDTRSFLSVVRSLGQAGYTVHVVCYDHTSPALNSKYIKSARHFNYQAFDQTEWLDNVIELIDRHQFDLVIPCDERAIYPLWSARERLPNHTKLAIANQGALDELFDKWQTKQVAIACDVPVARGRLVDLSALDYQLLREEFGQQFVIKPTHSFAQTKLHKRQNVRIVKSELDLAQYKKSILDSQPYLIEEFFSGKGEGVSVLSLEGEIFAAFAHVRVAEPKKGGGSSYRMSIPLDSALLKATAAICSRSALTGVAMFEYRRNLSTNEWILVEVNARFWGSLPLAVFAGVDFPKLYADFLVYGQRPTKPVLSYRNNVYARALTADVYEIRREFETNRRAKGRFFAGKHLLLRMTQIARAFLPRETVDSFDVKDPRPFFSELGILIAAVSDAFYKRSTLLLRFRRARTRSALRKLFTLDPTRRILFVCYGNIMRSPFAAVCSKKILNEARNKLSFASFGFHLEQQRRSPENAVEAAAMLGYDLTDHRSRWLKHDDLAESDIVIYFDIKNKGMLDAYYDVNHAFCAADLVDEEFGIRAEIDDPYGGDLSRVTSCYQQIRSCSEQLLDLYRAAAQ